jgi:hypothetical protein
MSTASRFLAIGSWPSDWCSSGLPASLSSRPSSNFLATLGPFTLAEAMNIVWNLESTTFNNPFGSFVSPNQYPSSNYPYDYPSYPTTVLPNQRVCGSVFCLDETVFGTYNSIWSAIPGKCYFDGTNYYFDVLCEVAYLYPGSPGPGVGYYWMTTRPGTITGWTLDHSFSGTILGKSITIYCWKTGSPTIPADTFTVTGNYYTY